MPTQIDRIRRHRNEILQRFDKEVTDANGYRFRIGANDEEHVGTPEFAHWLKQRHGEDLEGISTSYVANSVRKIVRETHGAIRPRGDSTPKMESRYTTRREIEVSRDRVLYIYIRSTDPDPAVVRVNELHEETLYTDEEET